MKSYITDRLITNTQVSSDEESSFFKKNINRVALVFLLILFIPLAIFAWQQFVQKTPKTWEIELAYNASNQQVSLKKITPLEKEIRPDYRDAKKSPYFLSISDTTGEVFYTTPIKINEFFIGQSIGNKALPSFAATTVVYVPYFSDAKELIITREGKQVVTINLVSNENREEVYSLHNKNYSEVQVIPQNSLVEGSGTPNSSITIILSPSGYTVTTKADVQGKWQFRLPKEIETGKKYYLSVTEETAENAIKAIKTYQIEIEKEWIFSSNISVYAQGSNYEFERLVGPEWQVWMREWHDAGIYPAYENGTILLYSKEAYEEKYCPEKKDCTIVQKPLDGWRQLLKDDIEFFGDFVFAVRDNCYERSALEPYFPDIWERTNAIGAHPLGCNPVKNTISEEEVERILREVAIKHNYVEKDQFKLLLNATDFLTSGRAVYNITTQDPITNIEDYINGVLAIVSWIPELKTLGNIGAKAALLTANKKQMVADMGAITQNIKDNGVVPYNVILTRQKNWRYIEQLDPGHFQPGGKLTREIIEPKDFWVRRFFNKFFRKYAEAGVGWQISRTDVLQPTANKLISALQAFQNRTGRNVTKGVKQLNEIVEDSSVYVGGYDELIDFRGGYSKGKIIAMHTDAFLGHDGLVILTHEMVHSSNVGRHKGFFYTLYSSKNKLVSRNDIAYSAIYELMTDAWVDVSYGNDFLDEKAISVIGSSFYGNHYHDVLKAMRERVFKQDRQLADIFLEFAITGDANSFSGQAIDRLLETGKLQLSWWEKLSRYLPGRDREIFLDYLEINRGLRFDLVRFGFPAYIISTAGGGGLSYLAQSQDQETLYVYPPIQNAEGVIQPLPGSLVSPSPTEGSSQPTQQPASLSPTASTPSVGGQQPTSTVTPVQPTAASTRQPTIVPTATQQPNIGAGTRGQTCTKNSDCVTNLVCAADYGLEYGHGADVYKCLDLHTVATFSKCVNGLECSNSDDVCRLSEGEYLCRARDAEQRGRGKDCTDNNQCSTNRCSTWSNDRNRQLCMALDDRGKGVVPEGQFCYDSKECRVGFVCDPRRDSRGIKYGECVKQSGATTPSQPIGGDPAPTYGPPYTASSPTGSSTTPTASTEPTKDSNGSSACGPIQIVFVSDGYDDSKAGKNQFDNDVERLKKIFAQTKPFTAAHFQFEQIYVENKKEPWCTTTPYDCLNNKGAAIESFAREYYGKATKIVLLTDSSLDPIGDAAYIGSTVIILPSGKKAEPAIGNKLAVHAVLGTAVSHLFPRYLIKDKNTQQAFETFYAANKDAIRNCSDSSAGDEFWRGAMGRKAGEVNAYLGCASPKLYAPVKATCGEDDWFESAGSPDTVMSAYYCAKGTDFDIVEQQYIKDAVFSYYKLCDGANASPIKTSATVLPTKPVGGEAPNTTQSPTKVPTITPTATSSAPTPTPNLSGKVTCEPEGGIEKRYDEDKLTVKNNTGKEVKFRVQYNVCPFKGETTPLPAGYECNTYKDHDEITLKAGESHTFGWGQDRHTTKAPIVLSSCQVGQIDVYNVTTPEGCIRTDNGKPWDGGLAFTIKANKTGYPDKCTEEATVQKQYQAYTCRENPNCPITTGFSACALICEPVN